MPIKKSNSQPARKKAKYDALDDLAFALTKALKRRDGWQNALTGMGIEGRDKRTSTQAVFGGPLNEQTVEQIYSAGKLARRIIDLLPRDATREWIKFKDDQPKIKDEVDRLQIRSKVAEAWNKARLYGGSGILLNTGEPPEKWKEPLDFKRIQKFVSLIVFNRHELQVTTQDIETNPNEPNFNMPKQYSYQPRIANPEMNNVVIHHTRIVRFDGEPLPDLMQANNEYWGDSVLTGVLEELTDYNASYAGVATLVQDFRLLLYTIEGLSKDFAAGQENKIRKRVLTMNLVRSILGTFVLDNDEKLESMSPNVSNLDKLLQEMKLRLQAATDIPHTILFNESPSGMSATGKSEERIWYDYVASQQEIYLQSRLDQLFKVMFLAKEGPTGGREPKDWTYDFVPLWQLSDKEIAETKKLNMETDKGYVEIGVLDAPTIREQRFPELDEPEA